MNNFDTSDYAMFSVGEFQDRYSNLAKFSYQTKEQALKAKAETRRNRLAKEIQDDFDNQPKNIDRDFREAKRIQQQQRNPLGRVKAHVRKTASGGLALVKGGMRKIGQNKKLAAGLAVGGAVAGGVGYATRKKRRKWKAQNDRAIKSIQSGTYR